MVVRDTLDGYQGELLIGVCKMSNLRCEDDIIVIATSTHEPQALIECLDTHTHTHMPLYDLNTVSKKYRQV